MKHEFARAIGILQSARELTTAEVAEKVGLTQAEVCATLRGGRQVGSFDEIARYAAAFDVAAWVLVYLAQQGHAPVHPTEELLGVLIPKYDRRMR